MPESYSTVLTCADTNVAVDSFSLNSESLAVGKDTQWSVRKFTLRGGQQEGVDVVEIDNGTLQFVVLPTRGMGILRGEHDGMRLGWDSPVKDPVHPGLMNLQERGGLGWLKGFNEWIVRCGLSSMGAPGTDVMIDNNGNPAEEVLNLHGKIANIPARKVSLEVTETEIILRGEVDETMLFGPAMRLNTEIRTEFGSGKLTINDTVTNLGAQPVEHQLLYHINLGTPLLEENAQLVCPIREMAPRDARAMEGMESFDRYAAPETGYIEQCYFFELVGVPKTGDTVSMLRNANGDRAAVVRYTLDDFPCFTLWKNTAAEADGYVTGFEPATAYPNPRQFEREQGRVISLAGGQSRSTSLCVEAVSGADKVQTVADEIAALQDTATATIHPEPVVRFSQI